MKFSSDTQNRIQSFKDKFHALGYDDGHYIFACHAAFPIAFTPDLLYQIWANFKSYRGYITIEDNRDIDIIAVSDLLMSNLCFSTGGDLFEMDIEIRGYLLSQLEKDLRFGTERLQTLAKFLYQYTDSTILASSVEEAHYWAALATLNPEKAVGQVKESLAKSIEQKDQNEILRMRDLLEAYVYQDQRFTGLFEYTRGIKAAIFEYPLEVVETLFDRAKILVSETSSYRAGEKVLEMPLWEALDGVIKIYKSQEEKAAFEEAKNRIANAKKDQALTLDLSRLGLKELPSEITSLTHLEELNISSNNLMELPNSISEIKGLNRLIANHNPIKTIPSYISKLKELTHLEITDAEITKLPAAVYRHKRLKGLYLRNNQIEFLPPLLGQMRELNAYDFIGNPVLNVPRKILSGNKFELNEYLQGLPLFEEDMPVMLAVLSDGNKDLKIQEERAFIQRELAPLINNESLKLVILENPSTVELSEQLRKFEKQLMIFHFGGSSEEIGLQFTNDSGDDKTIVTVKPSVLSSMVGNPENAKLFVFNGCKTHIFSKLFQGNKAEAVFVTRYDIADIDGITFAHNLYKTLADKETLGEAYSFVKNNTSSHLLSSLEEEEFLWELLPKEVEDFDLLKETLKELISEDKITQWFVMWSKFFPKHYKETKIKELRKEFRIFSNREVTNETKDSNTYTTLLNSLLNLIDKTEKKDTIAAQIRDWRLSNPFDFKKILSTPLLPMPVNLFGEEKLCEQFLEYYNQNPSIFLNLKRNNTSLYELQIEETALTIKEANSIKLIHGVSGVNPKSFAYIIKKLEQIEKWDRISKLNNETTLLDTSLVEIRFLDEITDKFYEDSPIKLEDKEEGTPFQIQARNISNLPLYIALLHLDAKFGISLFYESRIISANKNDWIVLDNLHSLKILEDEDLNLIDTFKTIVSTHPLELLGNLSESSIEPAITHETSMSGTRGVSFRFEKNKTDDWFTKDIIVELIRGEEEVWKKIQAKNELDDYLEYLSLFPNGKYRHQAEISLNQIKEKPKQASKEKINPQKEVSTPIEYLKSEVRNLIGKGQLKQALEYLQNNISHYDTDLNNSIIPLKGRLNSLNRELRMGILSNSEANVTRNKITASLLSLLEDLTDYETTKNVFTGSNIEAGRDFHLGDTTTNKNNETVFEDGGKENRLKLLNKRLNNLRKSKFLETTASEQFKIETEIREIREQIKNLEDGSDDEDLRILV